MVYTGTRPVNTRLAAIAYLASFLARAAFLPAALVVAQLQNLGAWVPPRALEQGVESYEHTGQMRNSFTLPR
jgi:hypothetical protein